MTDSGAYGKHLAAAFRLADAPTLLSRTSRDSTLAFTDLSVCPETSFRSAPIEREDAYLVCLYQSDHPRLQVWEDGKQISHGRVVNGETLILDLRKGPSVLVDRPFRAITFYLTRDALNEIADKSEAPRIAELDRTPAFGVADETVASLMQTVLAGFRQPEALGKLFVDHLGLALGTYIAQAYGGMKANSKALRGGLAPWQEKKIKDVVNARLGEELSVSDLANECNLSHRHFCRAFRHSLGTSPHAYIQHSRVDHAKKLLTSTEMKLTDVGSACGFADQSHFTRVFTQFAGTTPGIWRRNSVPFERVEISS